MAFVAIAAVFLSVDCWAFWQGVDEGVSVAACLLSLALLAVGIRRRSKALSLLGSATLLISLLPVLCGAIFSRVGCGRAVLACDVTVLDAATLAPVGGAAVEVRQPKCV